MANQNQDDTRRGDQSRQNRPNQGQPGRQGQQGQGQRRQDEDEQRDDQRRAGNQQLPDEPEIGDPIPREKRRPRDLPGDNNVDEDTRQADTDDVERERPNPRLQ
jgi:hypothetical protein